MRFIRIAAALLIVLGTCSLEHAWARSGGGFSGGGGGHSFGGGGGRGFGGGGSVHIGGGGSPKGFGSPAYTSPTVHTTPNVTTVPRTIQTSPAQKAPAVQFDSGAQRARQEAESQRSYREAHPPAPVQRTQAGATTSRDQPFRQSGTTSSRPVGTTVYRDRGPVYVYTDNGISPWFWIWLMDNNNQRSRDEWVYHNRDRVSAEQMDELRRKDAAIDQRLRELEQAGVQRDPSIKVPDVEAEVQRRASLPEAVESGGHFWLYAGILLLLGTLAYFFFFHRFPTRRNA